MYFNVPSLLCASLCLSLTFSSVAVLNNFTKAKLIKDHLKFPSLCLSNGGAIFNMQIETFLVSLLYLLMYHVYLSVQFCTLNDYDDFENLPN